MRNATAHAPPAEIPAKIPSSRARRRAVSSASPCVTDSVRSTRVPSKIFGRYSTGHFRIPGMDAPSAGWAPTIVIAGFCSFRYFDTPMIVPVVPIAETKCVMRPPVSRQISGPVVR